MGAFGAPRGVIGKKELGFRVDLQLMMIQEFVFLRDNKQILGFQGLLRQVVLIVRVGVSIHVARQFAHFSDRSIGGNVLYNVAPDGLETVSEGGRHNGRAERSGRAPLAFENDDVFGSKPALHPFVIDCPVDALVEECGEDTEQKHEADGIKEVAASAQIGQHQHFDHIGHVVQHCAAV